MTHEIVMISRRTDRAAFQGGSSPTAPPTIVVALALAAVVALLGVLARPSPPSLSTTVTGDAALAARARPLLRGALDRVSIAVVDGPAVTYAHFGADEHTEYEIGSITKTFTGLLLADAIAARRGHRRHAGSARSCRSAARPIADVTLAELASHRSGLSAQGMQLDDAIPFSAALPQPTGTPSSRMWTACSPSRARPRSPIAAAFVYSNLGVGGAGARPGRRGADGLCPAGSGAPLHAARDGREQPAPHGRQPAARRADRLQRGGRRRGALDHRRLGARGRARSTAADMVRYARALLDGSAPGIDALTPRWEVRCAAASGMSG